MKNNRDFKKIFKVFLLVFIVILSIYVLYFYNNSNNILENFTTSTNCSECKVNPSNNKCKPIYNIDYKWNPQRKMVDISNVMTDYILCEWEPNCNNNITENNYLTQEQRSELSNAQLQNYINVIS